MREIRFRAWNKVEKVMYNNAIYNCKDSFDTILQHPQVYEVMQYTGLKDMNGIEIYKGDIVKNKDDTLTVYGIIKFGKIFDPDRQNGGHQGFYILWQSQNSNEWRKWWRCDIHSWKDKVSICGNIYEDSDLLVAK